MTDVNACNLAGARLAAALRLGAREPVRDAARGTVPKALLVDEDLAALFFEPLPASVPLLVGCVGRGSTIDGGFSLPLCGILDYRYVEYFMPRVSACAFSLAGRERITGELTVPFATS